MGDRKSHLWREVQTASADEAVRGALVVSLFGLSDIDQLKKKLLESVVPVAESNPGLWESAKQAVTSGVKVLEGFHKSFGAISDFSLLLAPAMLRNKVIVIDDIERKHSIGLYRSVHDRQQSVWSLIAAAIEEAKNATFGEL